MCHNIRFHLGEYPHVSAKIRLGECADGSQIGRTYGLQAHRGVIKGYVTTAFDSFDGRSVFVAAGGQWTIASADHALSSVGVPR